MYKQNYDILKSMSEQIVSEAQETTKTPTRNIKANPGLMSNIRRRTESIAPKEPTQEEIMAKYMASSGLPKDFVEVIQAGPETPRPAYRGYVEGQRDLEADQEFMDQLNSMKERFPGLTDREIFLVIQGESSFNPRASNDSGARGLFQITPVAAEEAGIDYDRILDMSPAEQLREYEKYLNRWEYTGSHSLGVLQGAPAYRNADEGTVVYEVGSDAWKQNPGWRSGRNGPVTVGSIDAYYRRR